MIRDLIDAIAEGNTLAIDDSFNAVMASKISERLDDMRVSVAQNVFGSVDELDEEQLDEKSEQAKRNKIQKNLMDTSRGAKWKLQNNMTSDDVRNWDGKHKTTQAQNKAIGRALRSEDIDEAVGTAAKYAGKTGIMGGKYKSTDKALELTGDKFNAWRAKQSAKKSAEHKGQDPKLAAAGYGKHMVDIEKAKKNADARGVDASHLNWKHRNGVVSNRRLPEEFYLEDYSIEELQDFMMSEDFEQLDELSKKTLGSYVKKASLDNADRGINYGYNSSGNHKSLDKMVKRSKNIDKAVDKLTKEEFYLEDYSVEELEDFMMSEEFEQLDEVSQKTLTTYIHKAAPEGTALDSLPNKRHKGVLLALQKKYPNVTFKGKKVKVPSTNEELEQQIDEKVWDADGRNTTELKKQVRGLGDEHLKDWSKNKKSIFDTKTKKVQDRIISHEIKKRGLNKEEFDLDEAREERGDMGVDRSPSGSCRGSSMHSMDIAKQSGYTHAVMHSGTKGGIDTYHTTKAGAEKRLTAVRKKHGIPEYSTRARIAEL